MAITQVWILYWYELIEVDWGFIYHVYTSNHLWHIGPLYLNIDMAKASALEQISIFQKSDNFSLREDITEEEKDFMKPDFIVTLMLPLKTDIEIDLCDRKIINYGWYSFMWVNGNKDNFPFLIIPLPIDEYKINDPLFRREIFSSPILNKILAYLSILNLQSWLTVDIDYEYFKNYFGRKESVFIQQPWIPKYRWNIKFPESDFLFNIEISDADTLVLLWFFRDGLNNANIFSSFLSFFKIFENAFSNYPDRNNWIEGNYTSIYNFAKSHGMRWTGDVDIFEKLFQDSKCTTKWEYLYKIERLGIAHASFWEVFRSPDRFIDIYETYYSQQAIKFMAWYYLLQKLWLL